jgi:hypothetical protein
MSVPTRLNAWKLWLLGAVGGLLLVAAMAPAKAAACTSPIATKAGDGSIACVVNTSVNQELTYCDRDNDGHKVYARVSDSVTGSHRYTTTVLLFGDKGYDPNGASSGCGVYGHLGTGTYFFAWAVCVQTEGCSGWAHWPPYTGPFVPARLR